MSQLRVQARLQRFVDVSAAAQGRHVLPGRPVVLRRWGLRGLALAAMGASLALGGIASAVIATLAAGQGTASLKGISLVVDSPSVSGLSPTRPVTSTVTVHNPSGTLGLRVLNVHVIGVSSDNPACDADVLSLQGTNPALPTPLGPPGADRSVDLTVALSPSAPQVCQGAGFTLQLQVNGRVG